MNNIVSNKNTLYDSIDSVEHLPFMITWDTGKRCNFDCSYCGSDRHDNFSKFPPLKELNHGVEFIKNYLDIILPYRINKSVVLTLTGGEPTANPDFIPFIQNINKEFNVSKYDIHLNMTTNGSFSKIYIKEIEKNLSSVTISYHCDSDKKIKKRVLDNILELTHKGNKINVNLMMHPYDEYWKECITLIKVFESNNINFKPRVINGLEYDDRQIKWLRDYWQAKNSNCSISTIKIQQIEKDTSNVDPGRKMKKDVLDTFVKIKSNKEKSKSMLGRHCCSNFKLNVKYSGSGNEEKIIYLSDTNFEDWTCSVNWFFLHLESQTNSVFHHQTCQAKYGKDRGPITQISNNAEFLYNLKNNLKNKSVPHIICPNKKCGCGLCATKSFSKEIYNKNILNHMLDSPNGI